MANGIKLCLFLLTGLIFATWPLLLNRLGCSDLTCTDLDQGTVKKETAVIKARAEDSQPLVLDGLTLTRTDKASVEAKLTHGKNGVILSGSLGSGLPSSLAQPTTCRDGDGDGRSICLRWADSAKLTITKTSPDDACYDVDWSVNSDKIAQAEDCFEIGSSFWFGGAEEYYQHFPLDPANQRRSTPLLPGDMLQDRERFYGGVAEPFWFNSDGVGVWVPEGVPLFYSWNENGHGRMCLGAKYERPYVKPTPESALPLRYKICVRENAREIQTYGARELLGRPAGIPDERMIRLPIWSTWARYKAKINASLVLEFAREIRKHGFKDSQLEIDDNWESCYGDATFDTSHAKFPDPADMVRAVKDMGFRVTLWIHPFVNVECDSWRENALAPKAHFVNDVKGMLNSSPVNLPGLTNWWQGKMAGLVDFTNGKAVRWWTSRLATLKRTIGIDSFKFDAGESNWLPSAYRLNPAVPTSDWPAAFSTKYAEAVADAFGNMIEVRVGRRTQHLPVFVRMLDKDSVWGYDNGLKTMVTTLLQMNSVGYSFVLPDMIGGNGYKSSEFAGVRGAPTKELYVRWMQANVFMPCMQFSYVPWIYDQEVVDHALDLTGLHERFAPMIINLAKQAVEDGSPINRPIWWIDPEDKTALGIDSEFLLGDSLLVAPVLEASASKRDIYLPRGRWKDEANHEDGLVHEGPVWLRDYPADLWTLPYFSKV